MSRQRGGRSVPNIVLIILLVFVLLFLLGRVRNIQEQLKYAAQESYGSARLEVTGDLAVEPLGDMYEGNTEQGYTFYRIEVPVTNTGTESGDYLTHYIYGEEYLVKEYKSQIYDGVFYRATTEQIPPAADGMIDWIVQVKDGVTEIDLEIYHEQDGEQQGVEYNLQLPQET